MEFLKNDFLKITIKHVRVHNKDEEKILRTFSDAKREIYLQMDREQ